MPETKAAWKVLKRGGRSFAGSRVIYVDPVGVEDGLPKADIVLLTSTEPARYSPADVEKLSRAQTIVAGPRDCVARFRLNQLPLAPGQSKDVLGVKMSAVDGPVYEIVCDGVRATFPEGGN